MKYDKQYNQFYYSVDTFIQDNYAGLPSEGELTRIYNELPDYDVNYNSIPDTLRHIKRVSQLLTEACCELIKRANNHDTSKLNYPERELFDVFTPKLAGCTYGSEEYKKYLSELKVALDHHYKKNSHHPEHYPNGVNDMDLFDVIEMFFDWRAASERHNDGDIYNSIEINKKRFNISDQLAQILTNTAQNLNYEK